MGRLRVRGWREPVGTSARDAGRWAARRNGSGPPVCFAAVSDSHYGYQEDLIPDFVKDAVVSHPDAVGVLAARKFVRSGRTRFTGQRVNLPGHPLKDFSGRGLQVAAC